MSGPGKIRESTVEAFLAEEVCSYGGRAYKFTSPGRRAVPDRLVLMPINNPEHRRIVAQYVRFVELKAPGQDPTKPQEREHEKLFNLGHSVEVCRGVSDVCKVVMEMLLP